MNPILPKPFISRYRLKAKGFLNSISRRSEFEGVLIRVDGGYGCIHPWPELGDPTLDKCLADLAGPRRWPIVRRALRCAEYDQVARRFEHSLFEEMEIPESHVTLVRQNAKELAVAVDAGFTTVKMKAGRDLPGESAFLNEMVALYPQLRWRLDFNETLEANEAAGFLTNLRKETLASIDFVEDPCPYAEFTWTKLRRDTGVLLAVDREAAPLSGAAAVMIVKPAIDEPFLLAEAASNNLQKVVLTSYMDHPVGQTFAAWEAARLALQFPGLVDICGLQTHHLFEPNAFSELLGLWGPKFQAPAGYGLGFDDLLDEQPWTRHY